ncbi:MAG TPA: N-acyl homoserine lactonase family protein [Pseudonocardiaceae bacterium]|jgi:glyoxylase-like metal-dependent hydrolase (beta-lactamase superfamily II)|nr:N-acyl homoserine lactonase family protein [Pseudonocardiaceae bacterium]
MAYQVVIVKYGTRQTVRSDVYLNHGVYREPDGPIDMDYYFWVVRDRERTVLVDTGFSRAGGQARDRTFLLDPAAAYTALGVEPAAAPTVVVTHAHYDHIGNLTLFPDSPVVIAERELAFWTGPHACRAQFHHSVQDEELELLAKADQEGRVRTFRGRLDLAPGIEVIELGGHTPGQSVVLVDTTDGPVLLASDAIHYYEEYERDMPFAFVADLVAMYEGFDRIRTMVAGGEVRHVVSGHDPDTLSRFTPMTGELAGFAATIGELP